jgi:hypothetical protein
LVGEELIAMMRNTLRSVGDIPDMRFVRLILFLATSTASAAPAWDDIPQLIARAVPVAALRACSKVKLPWQLPLIISRDEKTGASGVAMPFPDVGIRGFTEHERCLMRVIAKLAVPPLPTEIERITVRYTVDTQLVAPALGDWSTLAHLATVLDHDRRSALAACSKRPVRLIIDERHGATRVWLPAWQFHSASGDGTTPEAQQPIKACLTREVARWKLATLPADLLELAVVVQDTSHP